MGRLFWWAWRNLVRRVDESAVEALAGLPPGRPVWSRVARRGVTDGLLGDSTRWLVLGGLAAVVLFMRRSGAKGEIVLREELRAGQGLLITDGFSKLGAVQRLGAGGGGG